MSDDEISQVSVSTQKQGTSDESHDEELIELVRQKPILYNSKSAKNKNVHLKDAVWMEIGNVINETGLWCKIRWGKIRDKYRREKAKKKGHTGQDSFLGDDWTFFKSLLFLDEHMVEGKTTSNISTEGTIEASSYDGSSSSAADFFDLPSPSPSPTHTQSSMGLSVTPSTSAMKTNIAGKKLVVHGKKSASDKIDEEIVNFLKKPKQDLDEHYHYCMALAEKMRKIDSGAASYAKMVISREMHKIEFPDYSD